MSRWRKCLMPLVPLYWAAVQRKNARFDGGHGLPRTLEWPVVSVGNLSAGGSGKTPFVMMLAQLLQQRGCAVDVLSRGYGRRSEAVEQVDPAGDVDRYGDEPLLIARRSGVPVYVGTDRYEAGRLAEQHAAGQFRPAPLLNASLLNAHLLDDGFQHRQLARDLDIVLVTLRDAHDRLLPAGNLREPLRSLRRADVVVLREEEADEVRQLVLQSTGDAAPSFWTVRRSIRVHLSLAEGEASRKWEEPRKGEASRKGESSEMGSEMSDAGAGPGARMRRPLAFCGIARPQDFVASLQQAGCQAAALVAFPDHHPYRSKDMEKLARKAASAGADSFVTTEKDAVKLTPAMRDMLAAAGPLAIAELSVELLDVEAAMQALMARLKRRS